MSNIVNAAPTKSFFVKMLTRDIDLDDSIMDLIDNCVDGILRTLRDTPQLKQEKPYDGFYAKLTINENEFIIEDNCGGIPYKIATEHAFRMGKTDYIDENLPTVGFYGIGMKRAIFKLGTDSVVQSNNSDTPFEVTINSEWLTDDSNWDLPLKEIEKNKEKGTKISVRNLYSNIAIQLKNRSFIDSFCKKLSKYYSFIINKGFNIYVNETVIKPVSTSLLFGGYEKEQISPYIYKGVLKDVSVLLEVGIYRNTPTEDEAEVFERRTRTSANSGWTVICNDRVVIHNDKTILTGWGEAGVPNYHPQFIGISGVVIFNSNNAKNLPLTTTKRGIDASSEIYLVVKEYMRKGTKMFTDYTNKWKNDLPAEKNIVSQTKSLKIEEIPEMIPTTEWINPRRKNKLEQQAKYFAPTLPEPPKLKNEKHIRFKVDKNSFEQVALFLLGDPNSNASDVGLKCFNEVLERIEKE